MTDISSLGNFSVSLAVKDIKASRAFYEALGFSAMHDSSEQGWLILTNGKVIIGLFQGMFENNILTFNPGWGEMAQPIEKFTDVREIQKDTMPGFCWKCLKKSPAKNLIIGRRPSSVSALITMSMRAAAKGTRFWWAFRRVKQTWSFIAWGASRPMIL